MSDNLNVAIRTWAIPRDSHKMTMHLLPDMDVEWLIDELIAERVRIAAYVRNAPGSVAAAVRRELAGS